MITNYDPSKVITKSVIQGELIENGFTVRQAKESVEFLFDTIREHILEGYTICFTNLGKIKHTFKEGGRPVRNPKSNEGMAMDDTIALRFYQNGRGNSKNHVNKFDKKLNTSDLIDLVDTSIAIRNESVNGKTVVGTFISLMLEMKKHEGSRCEIRGLGSFTTRKRHSRIGRNPKTGESVSVDDKYEIYYKAGKFKEVVIETLLKHYL
ncbi:HU family DNA-binding protein [Vibrio alginolyticus]|uniref:HU family DNA-binding protein n=1 Tax=Vibrio TaxID=662 RepID=UPI0006CA6808|nr:HU family DNA-binding protein [Vibrio alginolyticus]CAH7195429.1 hypothetical protein VCHA51O444_10648 [Vibrio chagasii]CAH7363157.1 hypothetical protein VCHA53O474_30455 [Vibrio chagasii]